MQKNSFHTFFSHILAVSEPTRMPSVPPRAHKIFKNGQNLERQKRLCCCGPGWGLGFWLRPPAPRPRCTGRRHGCQRTRSQSIARAHPIVYHAGAELAVPESSWELPSRSTGLHASTGGSSSRERADLENVTGGVMRSYVRTTEKIRSDRLQD